MNKTATTTTTTTSSSEQQPTSGTSSNPIGVDNNNNPQQQQQSTTTTNNDGSTAAAALAATAATATTKNTTNNNSEDDGHNAGTTSIETFMEYRPTALPNKVIRSCNEWYNKKQQHPTTTNTNTNNNNNNNCNKTDGDLNSPVTIDLTNENAATVTTTTTTEDSVEDSDSTIVIQLQVPSHTSSSCESALLSSVVAPMVPEETADCILPLLLLQQDNYGDGGQQQKDNNTKISTTTSNNNIIIPPPPLSPLQLEGVLLSIQRHRDGAGIGKGRQISAIIRDGLCRGRQRHVWFSVSRELIKDAERDLKDVGVYCTDELHDGTNFLGDDHNHNNKYSKGLGRKDKGILFLTYNLLVSSNRINQIIAWCAGTEHITHKAKNLANNTKTAQLVLELQRRLPMARIVYCSATGVSDIDQLGYAERLGLWKIPKSITSNNNNNNNTTIDDGTFNDFDSFRRSLEKRGLGSLELLALELKTRGSLMARTLSWEGAEFQTVEVPLDRHQCQVYDRGVKWWTECKNELQDVLKIVGNNGSSSNGQIWRTFWAAHQRFFKELAICADMSEFDLDSKYGKRALKRYYSALDENESSGGGTTVGPLSSTNTGEIIEEFIREITIAGDPILNSLPTDDEKLKHACVLCIATAELDRVGLDRETRSKGDVRIFLNRISGLIVTRQSLVFSLFMNTLSQVIKEVKSSGEFEGTAEDITATTIKIGEERDLAVDPSSGAQTKLTTLVLDRGISFDSVCTLAMEETKKLFLADDNLRAVDQDSQKEINSSVTRTGEENEDDFIKQIAGRHLVLFARRKFDRSSFNSDEEDAAFDPLGLMQLTRPNTGTILTDKSTQELRQKYRLAFSCEELRVQLSSEEAPMTDEDPKRPIGIIKKENAQVSRLWEKAFEESDGYKPGKGLAPRRQKVSLVNGPVLHILPALEKSVEMKTGKDKALKIMRAQVGSRRIVGVRFPSDSDAIEKLHVELDKIIKARSNAGNSFTDEALAPICTKTMKWATTKRKTMKSFFQVTSSTNSTSGNSSSTGKNLKSNIHNKTKTSAVTKSTSGEKRSASNHSSSGKKPKTMMSFFAKKK
ncbi:hypothetical protein FRACYDRAFT_257886 [Fragilariopsis cylindrus CCMP1102]|uniref:Uncharacterized protein n=1 Tax=Fragilariopsis cylindrus CCMP1102 TaxID=635003 RepID=A0A1E7EJ03_9STRA|nr:hypothetical protein FRACYDRAFT_257886 [Fragilariopsis cylindrus CCMP1102]|eukprot:OEU05850.1 hypothetical protein FRACYDRAFT_257886 [Fragilariopsis cylindrus CCMP1102]